MLQTKDTWKTAILASGIIVQIIFILEILLFHNIIVVDPQVHRISYENWTWLVYEWTSPHYWDLYSEAILTVVRIINRMFQMLFGIYLIYIYIRRDRFSLTRKAILLPVAGMILLDIALRYYIRYHVDFYRVYMYSTYNVLMGLYMIYCGRRHEREWTVSSEQPD